MSETYARALEGVDLAMSAEEAASDAGALPPSSEAPTGATAPGTGTDETSTTAPPAEAKNTETEQGSPSQVVPYTRFKEVNDQLRDFKTLEQEYGYDADSLRQLAEWADRFDTDPVQSWLSVASQMDGLPDHVRQAVQTAVGSGLPGMPTSGTEGQTPSGNSDTNGDEEPPIWARELQAKVDRIEQTENQKSREEMLEGILTWWDSEDKRQNVRSPSREVKLTFLSGASASAEDIEDLQQRARAEYLEEREAILQGTIVQPGSEPPSSVPGGAAPVNEPPPKPKTLAEASRMVEEDVRAGRLKMD